MQYNSVSSSEFRQLDVPQSGYGAGNNLYPSKVIAGYNSELGKYDADSWAAYVLEKCKAFEAGRTAVSYSAVSGDADGRSWFGYAFRAEATVGDFVKADEGDIQDLRAYTRF